MKADGGGHGGEREGGGRRGLALISLREKKGRDQHLPPDPDLPRGKPGAGGVQLST